MLPPGCDGRAGIGTENNSVDAMIAQMIYDEGVDQRMNILGSASNLDCING